MDLLQVNRRWFTERSTVGELLVDARFQCFTLEDKWRDLSREPKVPRETCIPDGRYQVVIDFSQRFGRPMPHILNVPHFEGIRFHPGNTPADTEGCPVLGQARQLDRVLFSVPAFDAFLLQLQAGLAAGDVFVNVTSQRSSS